MVKTVSNQGPKEKRVFNFRLIMAKTNQWVDGSYPVCMVIRKNGQRKVISLNISSFPEQWNESFQRYEVDSRKASLHPLRQEYNEKLNDLADRSKKIIKDLEHQSLFWTVEQFEVAFLDKVVYHLKSVKKMQNTTISIYLRSLRTLLNEAIKDDVGCPQTYPFSNKFGGKRVFSISKELNHRTRKRYIPLKYLRLINEAQVPQPHLMLTKHIFLFSFFAGGMNFKDIALLKKANIESGYDRSGNPIRYFTFSRAKTHEEIQIVLNEDILRQIDCLLRLSPPVDDYLLPCITVAGLIGEKLDDHILNKRRRYNLYLKQFTKAIGLPDEVSKISSYFARHSYAMALLRKGNSIDLISEAMHHSDTKTTKIYLESFGRDEIARISEGLLD